MGPVHNDALDHVLGDLKVKASAGQLTRGNIYVVARSSLTNYFADRGYGTLSDQTWSQGYDVGRTA